MNLTAFAHLKPSLQPTQASVRDQLQAAYVLLEASNLALFKTPSAELARTVRRLESQIDELIDTLIALEPDEVLQSSR